MGQIIFHIDVNSAFLSWTAVEQLKNGAEQDIREIPTVGYIFLDKKREMLNNSLNLRFINIHNC